ncbi:hypothetical protein V8D89_003109 [Ganoderma adspersum]
MQTRHRWIFSPTLYILFGVPVASSASSFARSHSVVVGGRANASVQSEPVFGSFILQSCFACTISDNASRKRGRTQKRSDTQLRGVGEETDKT